MAREKVIFYVDVNSAFLGWEATYRIRILGERLDLRDIPHAYANGRDIFEVVHQKVPNK